MNSETRSRVIRRGYLRKVLIIATLVIVVLFPPSALTFFLGSGVLLLGALLHLWTKGCLLRNEEITICGPYRFVRHPFYVANALIDFGICIIANYVWLYVVYSVLFLIAYARTIMREEKYLAERHGDVWQAYRKRVPMLIPYRRPAPAAPGSGFRWENLVREGELPRFLRLLAYPLVFHVWIALFNLGGTGWNRVASNVWNIVQEIGVLKVIEAVVIIALFEGAAILRRHLPSSPQVAAPPAQTPPKPPEETAQPQETRKAEGR